MKKQIIDNNLILSETEVNGIYYFKRIDNANLTKQDLIIIKYVFIKYLKEKYKNNFTKINNMTYIDINYSINNYEEYAYLIINNYHDLDYLLDKKTNGIKKTLRILYPKKNKH